MYSLKALGKRGAREANDLAVVYVDWDISALSCEKRVSYDISMVGPDELIARLRQHMRLPSNKVSAVEEALATGEHRPREALKMAGLQEDQIERLLGGDPGPAAPPTNQQSVNRIKRAAISNVSTLSEEPSVDDLISRLIDITPRFELQGEIARGAMGRILAAWDTHLGRAVAVKVLRKSSAKDLDRVRFLEEAQVTGQLQHPSIMPVYELGRLRGQVAFVMRRVEGRSLKEIIAGLRRGEKEFVNTFGHMRLLNIFHQLCLAVAFAHTRGVVHRDLKPSNVMVGDFGEVILLDWGLCKVIGQDVRSNRSTSERWKTVHGQIIGTPAYMAPEQAAGLINDVDQRTDVYGLGAILYHLLTLRPPFTGQSNREIVTKVLKEEVVPPSERAPNRQIPAPVQQICMGCLARNPNERFNDASELAEAIRGFLDAPTADTATLSISSRAAAMFKAGLGAIAEHQSYLEDAALINDELQTARGAADAIYPDESQNPIWEAESRLNSIQAKLGDAYARAESSLSAAVALGSDNKEARQQLCELLLTRYEHARARLDHGNMAYYRRMLAEQDDGRYSALINGEGSIHVAVEPSEAYIKVDRLREQSRRLVVHGETFEGHPPVKLEPVEEGTYRIEIRAEGWEPLISTLLVEAGRCTRVRFRLVGEGKMPPGFVYVPAGAFRCGDRSDPFMPPTEEVLSDFFISQYPVTQAEYLNFINALVELDPDEALSRVPRHEDGVTPLWQVRPDGFYVFPHLEGWNDHAPVVGISALDAQMYCRWLSSVEKWRYRLPASDEWEKAARGSEGRCFPWGEGWEPGFSACASTWNEPWPPPIGYAPKDVSAFGVHDCAGGVREWTGTSPSSSKNTQLKVLGGSFRMGHVEGRPLWVNEALDVNARFGDLGFRLAVDLSH